MTGDTFPARQALLDAARRSPEIATLHDEAAWVALYTADAVIEDPVGTPACQRGVFTRPGKLDDLSRFFRTFIAPSTIRVEALGEFVVGNTVIRDVVLHVKLPGGGGASVPAILRYELVDATGKLLVARMRAYWDAGRNGRELLASGWKGKLTSTLSGLRLMRVLGKEWTGRYIKGTKHGIRRDGPKNTDALASALAAGDTSALDSLVAANATATLPDGSKRAIRELGSLGLSFTEARSSGFVVAARVHGTQDGRPVKGIAFVEFDETSKKVSGLELFWE